MSPFHLVPALRRSAYCCQPAWSFTLGTLLSRYIRTTTDSNKLKYRPSRREGTSRRELSMVVISRPATAACYAWRIRAADAGGALGEGKAALARTCMLR